MPETMIRNMFTLTNTCNITDLIQCNTETPCESCPHGSHNSAWRTLGCKRGSLKDQMPVILLCPGLGPVDWRIMLPVGGLVIRAVGANRYHSGTNYRNKEREESKMAK
jgi:hypothetical protein